MIFFSKAVSGIVIFRRIAYSEALKDISGFCEYEFAF